jgi:hypothetical protein
MEIELTPEEQDTIIRAFLLAGNDWATCADDLVGSKLEEERAIAQQCDRDLDNIESILAKMQQPPQKQYIPDTVEEMFGEDEHR